MSAAFMVLSSWFNILDEGILMPSSSLPSIDRSGSMTWIASVRKASTAICLGALSRSAPTSVEDDHERMFDYPGLGAGSRLSDDSPCRSRRLLRVGRATP